MPSLREQVYERARGRCEICGINLRAIDELREEVEASGDPEIFVALEDLLRMAGFTKIHTFEVDQEHPRALGGTDDLDNLRCVCVPCHREKTNSEGPRNRKIRRVQRKVAKGKM